MDENEPFNPVTDDEIKSFINAKKCDKPCYHCENTEWILYASQGGDYHPVVWRRYPPMNHTELGIISCFLLVCSSCGYVKSFAKHMVLKWLRESK